MNEKIMQALFEGVVRAIIEDNITGQINLLEFIAILNRKTDFKINTSPIKLDKYNYISFDDAMRLNEFGRLNFYQGSFFIALQREYTYAYLRKIFNERLIEIQVQIIYLLDSLTIDQKTELLNSLKNKFASISSLIEES
jgi:hypothetical protein